MEASLFGAIRAAMPADRGTDLFEQKMTISQPGIILLSRMIIRRFRIWNNSAGLGGEFGVCYEAGRPIIVDIRGGGADHDDGSFL